MIIGIGIDIVELDRMKEIIQKNDKFIDRVLTDNEREIFDKLGEKRKVEFLGGRFSCKEAFSKAYGTGIGKVKLTDIEILREENGRPIVVKSPFEGKVHVSISHTNQTAIAQIILEK
ncbi:MULTISPECIES: holo-ACP synthase [Vagococcus]|uniref:Holo-[acyl-carrier-protein] synthase n=1 Tax=Vagococcus fluvialis bH819 TaxID=1255619 RepID=A0A1X6WMZ6_9ENTE|nr:MULTISPECIES: holo-ACP synthase [Vagococcus]SLM85650.1 Holo-[acyl-carrier protein] synthase [Vagococcus fluvialis bH819]HCM89616.1 holo-ACP synthase [Vagococcus sp.]